MRTALYRQLFMQTTLGFMVSCAAVAGGNGSPSGIDVESGTASFEASTNIPGVEVKGKSGSLTARVDLQRDSQGIVLQQIEGSLPVKTLLTGMKLRDEHMRKYIFTTSDSQVPDIHFTADRAVCPAAPEAQEFTCQISGNLSIRAVSHAFTLNLNVKSQSASTPQFRAIGNAVVKLSDYGITPPSQFGVTTANEIKLHIEFSAKQRPVVSARTGGAE